MNFKVKDGINLTSTTNTSSFKTLLGKEIKLDQNENVFIKDNEIINLAGIMGGETTKCSIPQLLLLLNVHI